MKKLLSFVLAISMVFSIGSMSSSAVEIENQPIQETDIVQQEIDAILTELNEMATAEKMAAYLVSENCETADNLAKIKAQNDQRKQTLEARLDTLGVNTIDPNDPEDMAALEEVMHGNGDASVQSSAPPDLAAFADAYTLRQYNGNTVINNTLYRYSYIYVTDDKGYERSPLTHMQIIDLVGRESTVLQDILNFQFSFGFSAYLGTIPQGWIADWAIGTLFAGLESFSGNSNVLYDSSGSLGIYGTNILSDTQMMYVYVHWPSTDEWYLCGSRASNISVLRRDWFLGKIGGTPINDSVPYPMESSSTGSSAISYVRAYVENFGDYFDCIGSLTLNTYGGGTVSFAPGFATYPINLIG